MKRITVSALAGIIALCMFAGCNSSKSTVTEGLLYSSNEPLMYEDEAGVTGEWYSDEAAEGGDMLGLNMDTAPETPAGNIQNEVTVDPSQSRLLIRTVYISGETKNLDAIKSDLESRVKEAGGYIENSSMSGTGNDKDLRSINYTVRVPADKLDSIIESVGNGCTILNSSENTSDVTLEYVDTKSRIESLRVEYDQLLELLAKAEDLDTIIVLQSRLSDVRYEIESYEARIRVLENQVLFATLNLTVREVLEETVVEEPHVVTFDEKVGDQFKETWENTVDFFQGLILGIISVIPGLVVFTVITIAVLVIVFANIKKRKRRKEGNKPESVKEELKTDKEA